MSALCRPSFGLNLEITLPNGEKRTVEISHFPALDGWDIQQRFVEFAASHDKAFRRAYTLEVLAYAVAINKGARIELKTSAIIDNHLGDWHNVEAVFEAILKHNGIDPKTHADRPVFWEKAGAEMATSFLAEVTRAIGPAMEIIAKQGA
jgi:hypothetical protein